MPSPFQTLIFGNRIKTRENRYQIFLVLTNFVSFNSSKRCALEVDLEYPNELRKLHKEGYPVVLDKKEIMRCLCHICIEDLQNTLSANFQEYLMNF